MLKDVLRKIDDFAGKIEHIADEKQAKSVENKGGFKQAILLIFKPYDLLFTKFLSFFVLAMVFVAAGIGLSAVFGFLSQIFGHNVYVTALFMLIYASVVMGLAVLFMQKWYSVSFMHEKIGKISFKKSTFIKAYGLSWLFFALFMLPIISFAVLYNREPNPDWVLELAVFTSYAALAIVPFMAIRFAVCYAFLFRQEEVPTLKQIWENTQDNIRAILLSFGFLLLFIMLFFAQSMSLSGIDGIFWRYFAIAVFAALITLSAEVQRIELFDEENDSPER